MSRFPTTCPGCHAPEVLYSTGVLHHPLCHAITAPVIRCGRCHAEFFARPPEHLWTRCSVSALIVFTNDPQEIDVHHTLAFRLREGGLYHIYPVLEV